jgi:hypothetical protein
VNLGPHTVTRLRAGATVDRYGNTVPDWTMPAELEISGCSVQPGPPRPEDLIDRDSVTTLYTIWAPAGADVSEQDRIRYAGTVYAVDGTIQRWDFPPLDHLVVALKNVEG